jgi:signal peptidase I
VDATKRAAKQSSVASSISLVDACMHRAFAVAVRGGGQQFRRLPSLALSVPPKQSINPSCAVCGIGKGRFNSSKSSKDGNSSLVSNQRRSTSGRKRDDGKSPAGTGPRLRSSRGQADQSSRESFPSSSLSSRPRAGASSSPPPTSTTAPPMSSWPLNFVRRTLQRFGGGSGRGGRRWRRSWTREHVKAAALRLPLWMSAAYLALLCDGTSPIAVISVVGPSMVPTMAPDRTDAWLVIRYPTFWLSKPVVRPRLAVGDLVGVQVPFPNTPPRRQGDDNIQKEGTTSGYRGVVVSCKRVIGVEGDVVKRYGQFVQMFVSQDPTGYGVVWPDQDDGDPNPALDHHRHLDPSCPWDDADRGQIPKDPHRTLVVPPGHVWVEGDCPGLAVDSRHYGPVPLEAVRGKVVARLWPLRDGPEMNHRRYWCRPHPIPLDDDTLRQYNVHRLKSPPSPVAEAGGV